MMVVRQQELFDAFLRHRQCLRCRRTLHVDRKARFRNRQTGLCFVCVREFEQSSCWSIDSFLQERCRQ